MKTIKERTEKRAESFIHSGKTNVTGSRPFFDNTDYVNYPGVLDHGSLAVFHLGNLMKRSRINRRGSVTSQPLLSKEPIRIGHLKNKTDKL